MTTNEPIKVLIADDHGIVREALRRYLQQLPEFEVVGEAKTGIEVLELCRELSPDIVIMDISMPGMDGIECSSRLRVEKPQVKVLALTCHDDEEHLKKSLLAGANAYVLKSSFSEDLRLALLTVFRGGTYIDGAIAESLCTLIRDVDSDNNDQRLSNREIQVIALIAKGLSLKDVGKQMKISLKTVETYKSRSLKKLNLTTKAELVKFVAESDLFKEPAAGNGDFA